MGDPCITRRVLGQCRAAAAQCRGELVQVIQTCPLQFRCGRETGSTPASRLPHRPAPDSHHACRDRCNRRGYGAHSGSSGVSVLANRDFTQRPDHSADIRKEHWSDRDDEVQIPARTSPSVGKVGSSLNTRGLAAWSLSSCRRIGVCVQFVSRVPSLLASLRQSFPK